MAGAGETPVRASRVKWHAYLGGEPESGGVMHACLTDFTASPHPDTIHGRDAAWSRGTCPGQIPPAFRLRDFEDLFRGTTVVLRRRIGSVPLPVIRVPERS